MKATHGGFLFLLLLILAMAPSSLGAADFGLSLGQYAEGRTGGDEPDPSPEGIKYQASLLPHFSLLVGDSIDVFASAGISLNVENDVYGVFEPLRTEFSYRSGNWRIRAGRIYYADPMDFVATGLFDGARFTYNTMMGNLGIGAWYTGLLYKKRNNITMTAADQLSWSTPLDYDNFSDTFFASRRFLMSLDWDHPSVAELVRLKAALTIQADLSDGDEKYHSQYLILKATLPYSSFLFELGGSFEIAEFEPTVDDKDSNVAFAWDMGVFWTPPTSFNSRLSLTGRFAGGNTGDAVGAFVPITGKLYGDVLQAKLSGISVLSLDYTARIIESFEASLSASHFVRNDLGTYMAWPVNYEDNSGYFLGTELFLRLDWSPFSDLQLSLGGGVFLPGTGDVNPDEKPKWHVELTAVLAVY